MTLPITTGDVDLAAFLDELRLWVEMETPSGDAAAVNRLADRIEVLARDARFSVERTAGTLGFGDILAVRTPRLEGYNAKSVLILAHIDTVHATGTIQEKLPLREDGDRLFGPGIYDMKAGVLMALEAMKLATKMGHNLPIDLLIVPDEEVGSKSSRPLIEEFARNAAYVLVVEPARLVLELEALNDPVRGITVTTGTIHGGTGRNTIPAECRLQLDLRLPDAAIAAEVIDKIRGMTPVDPDITFEISGDLNRPPFAQSEEGRRLFDHTARIAAELGIMLEGMVTGGGSDGNFTAALGVPTLDGLGADGAGAHTFDEHILVSSLVPRTVLLANLMASLDSKA